jgi:O-antigen/teichoic acid export membrane protein
MVFSALALALLTYGSLPWSVKWLLGNESYSSATCYAALASGVTMLVIPFDNRLRLDERPLGFISASFLSTFVIGGLTLWFVIGLARGVRGYFEALLIGRLVSFFAFYVMAGGLRTLKFSRAVVCKLLSVGVPIMPQFLILYFLQYGNVDLLKRISGLEQAGIFAAGLTIGLSSNVVISSVANAWAPFFLSYSNRQEDASELFGRITKYYILGVGLFSLLFYYFDKVLMLILSAPEYFSGYQVVGPVATGMFMLGLFNMFLPPVYYAKEVGKLILNSAAAVTVQIALGYALIPLFGIIGAAWTLVCAYAAHAFFLLILNLSSPRYLKITYQWSALARFGILYFTTCLGLSLLSHHHWSQEILTYLIHFSCMSIVAYRALDADEVKKVRRYLLNFNR